MLGQGNDILGALAQGGHAQLKLAKPMEKILAKAAGGNGRIEILIGGGNDTDIDLNLAVTAEPVERISIQDTQELDLSLQLQFADFIEEERTLVGKFEQAGLGRIGARKRAFFVAE
jgi:hypothetical protein